MDHSDGQLDGDSRPGPDMRKHPQPPPGRGDLARREQVELVTTAVYPPRSPAEPPRRNRLLLVVGALVVVLVLVLGILIGVLVAPGTTTAAGSTEASPTTTPAPRPTTSAPPTTTLPTSAPPQTGSAPTSGAGGPVELTGVSDTQQLRVTPSGQDLDRVVGDEDRSEELAFSSRDNEFEFARSAARWPEGAEPTADDCARQIAQQPLSDGERYNLTNNPLASVCTYTSHGNIAFARSLDVAEGDGVQMAVTVWQVTR